jgi:hypothetical protein
MMAIALFCLFGIAAACGSVWALHRERRLLQWLFMIAALWCAVLASALSMSQ